MIKYKKGMYIFFIIVLLIVFLSILFCFIKDNKKTKFDYNKAIEIVKIYVRSQNEHNIEKAKNCFLETKNNIESKSIENEIKHIDTVKFVSAENSKVKYEPKYYVMKDGKEIKLSQGVILRVIYNITYNNKSQPQPEMSGQEEMFFEVVKIGNTYKIASIGTGP